MESYRGNQSRLPAAIQKPDSSAEENGADSSNSGGGGSGGAGGGDDFVLAALQGAVADAAVALQRAQASGIGVNSARAALATARRLVAEHGFGAATTQVHPTKRSKTGGKASRPRSAPRQRRRRDKGKS